MQYYVFIKLFCSPQDIEYNLATEKNGGRTVGWTSERTNQATERKPFHSSFFVWFTLCALLYRRLFISYVNIFDVLSADPAAIRRFSFGMCPLVK